MQHAVVKFVQRVAPLYVKLNAYLGEKLVKNAQYYFSKWQVEMRLR